MATPSIITGGVLFPHPLFTWQPTVSPPKGIPEIQETIYKAVVGEKCSNWKLLLGAPSAHTRGRCFYIHI